MTPYDRALFLLEARPRSVAELRRGLRAKGVTEAEIEPVIERLLGAGLLDDPAFARQFARGRLLNARWSRRRVQQELRRRGVAGEIAEAAVEEVAAEEGLADRDSIERIARKKLSMLGALDPPVIRRRLYAFLARRGYESGDIVAAIERLLPRG